MKLMQGDYERAKKFQLDLIEEAADNGERCPGNVELRERAKKAGFTIPEPAQLPNLAKAGYIRIELYAKNWRVVVINGKRTQEPPFKNTGPYLVIDGKGNDKLAEATEL